MIGLRRGSVALCSALVASCASAPPAERSAVGCYQFERNDGERALGLPWGFELEAAPLGPGWPLMAGRADVRRARTATSPTGRDDHPFGYWWESARDSVEVGYPGGGGITLRLGWQSQDLLGQGTSGGDAVPAGGPAPRTSAPVVARRVLCVAS